jgi:N-methylhydantoinase B
MITARNRDHAKFASWGLLGGKAGSNSMFTRNPGRNNVEELGNRDIVSCEPGDVIRIVGGGGGGWGDPLDRPPAEVAFDVAAGLVSPEQARAVYRVAFKGGEPDIAETERLRAAAPRSRAPFDFGPGRDAFERVWTQERYDALTDVLAATAVTWRHWAKRMIFQSVARGELADRGPAAQIRALHAALAARFPQMLIAMEARAEAAE